MCLTVKRIRHLNGKAKVAKRNIPCLKVLYMCSNGKLVTPYMWKSIEQNEIVHGLFADKFVDQTRFALIKNGIYSYKPTRRVLANLGEIAIAAYIPKGTKYWIGKDGEYVSECIKFN